MKLIFSILKFEPTGGKERDFAGIVDLFAERGHDITILLSQPTSHSFNPRARVHVLSNSAWTNHGGQRAFSDAVCLYRQEERDLDALIAFDWISCADFIFVANSPFAERDLGWKRLLPHYRARLHQEAEALRSEAGPFTFFLCEAQAARYRSFYDLPRDRFAVMPATFGYQRELPDVYYTARPQVREELGIPRDAPVLVHIAANGYLKGLDRVIDLLPLIPEAFLISIGEASPSMQRHARRVGVEGRIRFLGPSDSVPRLLEAGDLLVHPARNENTGTVILESLIYGIPVVASAECGYAEHVTLSGAGAVVPNPFDQTRFAELVQEALGQERLADMKAAARRYGQVLNTQAGLPHVVDAMFAVIADARAHTRSDNAADKATAPVD